MLGNPQNLFARLFRFGGGINANHALGAAIRMWLRARGADAGDHVAVDGKTARGSADGPLPGVHRLAAYATGAAAVLGQLAVARTTNEHKAALRLLDVLPPSTPITARTSAPRSSGIG